MTTSINATRLVRPRPRLETIRCACGWAASEVGAVGRWLLVAHRSEHEPGDVLVLPSATALRLCERLASAQGVAQHHALDAADDLAIARAVLWACGTLGTSDTVVHRRLVAAVANAAERCAIALASLPGAEHAAKQLEEVAWLAATLMEAPSLTEHERSILAALTIRVRPPSRALSVALAQAQDATGGMLFELPPESPYGEVLGGRNTAVLVEELAALPQMLGPELAYLAHLLGLVAPGLGPVAVVAERVLDRLADCVLELQLARLRAEHLGALVECSLNEALSRWARSTTRIVSERLATLCAACTFVLEYLSD